MAIMAINEVPEQDHAIDSVGTGARTSAGTSAKDRARTSARTVYIGGVGAVGPISVITAITSTLMAKVPRFSENYGCYLIAGWPKFPGLQRIMAVITVPFSP